MDAPGNEPSESEVCEGGAPSAVKKVADASLPLEVGSLALGEDGHIEHGRDEGPLHFNFTACGIHFEAELAGKTAPLRLTANLGKLPYSAESPDGRGLARSVLAATDRLRRGQILLSDDHDMILQGELMPPSPRTPVNVIATATALILDFKPYLDLLAEAISVRRPAGEPAEADDQPADDAEMDDAPVEGEAAAGET
ncbi:hypothetical protein HBA54_20040 [Pelagibius litoralis]|uniref:Uncharacterized protein n=1 Tax=Pelagibius litoralis TaxID=374515 RepID=A0A967F0M4_9PROT|nr:hypothetical protein [Pelagibius litoralis]NIA70895.1 hypothetical protein [Pelagibius litoralis]